MATPEQITERLRQRIESKDDLRKFADEWGGGIASNIGWKSDEIIPKNIERIVNDAIEKGHLNKLGMRLGFPSDEHAAYTRNTWTDRRSWIALIASILALVVSAIALFQKD